VEFGRWKAGQLGGFGTFEFFAGIGADLSKSVPEVGAVTHQPACFNIFTQRKSRRYPVARCQGSKLGPAAEKECVAADEEGIRALALKAGKGRINLADRTRVEDLDI